MTATPPRLTIMLPLKGRYLFTLRILWHANLMRMPYRFLIADGQAHPALTEVLDNSAAYFPNLDIQYIRYPDDRDFSHFYNKLADALGRVTTPYVMHADNDDFLGPGAIGQALDFLDTNSDYACCGGRMTGFSVYSGLDNPARGFRGRLNRLRTYPLPEDVSSPSVAERLRQGSLRLWIYYAVHRSEALATVMRDIARLNFSDLLVYEVYHVMRSLTLGKAKANPAGTTYFCQDGTSLNSGFKSDWVHHLLRSRFTSDIEATVDHISALAAAADGTDQAAVAEDIRAVLDAKFRQFVWANYGSRQELKQFVIRQAPDLVTWWRNFPNPFVGRQRSALLRSLADAGASRPYVESFRAEIAAIEEVVSGQAFADFVRPFAQTLGQGIKC